VIGCQSTPPTPKESEPKTSAALPGQGVSVRFANSGLLEAQFIIGLEQLGYKIEKPKAVDHAVMLITIANGDLDYTPGHVERLHETFFENADGEDSPEDIRNHPVEWVKNNQEQFDSWLEEASTGGLKS